VKAPILAFGAGVLFSAGLAVSQMTQASKVVGFLDVTGAWDPSLAFVMVGAIGVHLVLQRLIRRRGAPMLAGRFHLPTRRDISGRLVVGSALFGAGWGVAGFCPGPALTAVGAGLWEALLFVPGMVGGMVLFAAYEKWRARAAAPAQLEAPSGALFEAPELG
jgi:uncharacterized protein